MRSGLPKLADLCGTCCREPVLPSTADHAGLCRTCLQVADATWGLQDCSSR